MTLIPLLEASHCVVSNPSIASNAVVIQRSIDNAADGSHTFGMKAAVSIPDDLFADADRLASRFKTSRSQLYARALAEFLARHDDDSITEALNQTYALQHGDESGFVSKATASVLRKSQW